MTSIAECDAAMHRLIGAMDQLPAGEKALRKIGAEAIEELRKIKVALLAAQPSVLNKTSAPKPQLRKRDRDQAPSWRGLPVAQPEAQVLAKESRSRAAEQRRLSLHKGGPTRFVAPDIFHGKDVGLAGGGRLHVDINGFCELHAGAPDFVKRQLETLGFKQCPRNPDDCDMGSPASVDLLGGFTKALQRPMIGDAGLVSFLNRRR